MACAALLPTGCGGETAKAARPTPTASASDAEAVKETYRGFVALLDRADTLPPETRRQRLAAYMTEPQLSRVLDRVAELNAKKITAYGSSIVHIRDVRVDGNTATVRDCQDAGNSGLMDSATRRKVNRGGREVNINALLAKEADGRWRIRKYLAMGQGC